VELMSAQRLMEVKDLCDVEVPDERSVMTYVAEFFHKFSSEGESLLPPTFLISLLMSCALALG